jgi:hypothetical protein
VYTLGAHTVYYIVSELPTCRIEKSGDFWKKSGEFLIFFIKI